MNKDEKIYRIMKDGESEIVKAYEKVIHGNFTILDYDEIYIVCDKQCAVFSIQKNDFNENEHFLLQGITVNEIKRDYDIFVIDNVSNCKDNMYPTKDAFIEEQEQLTENNGYDWVFDVEKLANFID